MYPIFIIWFTETVGNVERKHFEVVRRMMHGNIRCLFMYQSVIYVWHESTYRT